MKPSPEDIVQAIYDAAEKGLRVVVVGGPSLGTVDLGPMSLAALEEIQVNVTGEGGIATELTLAALLALLTPGTPEQYSGSVGIAGATVTFSGPTKHVIVHNPEFASTLEVSFNGGVSYLALAGRSQISMPCRTTNVRVRATSGTVDYAVVATT